MLESKRKIEMRREKKKGEKSGNKPTKTEIDRWRLREQESNCDIFLEF